MSTSHTDGASPGPYFVFEACREAALGDVQRGGEFAYLREALRRAADIHQKNGTRTYVLSAAGSCVAAYDRHRSDEKDRT